MTNKRDQREALFAALSEGIIEPKQAETRAAELGLEPLTTPLDTARYNPMQRPHWTLAMTLAWIVWRTADAVRDLMPEWRRDHSDWYWREHLIGDGANGHEVRAGWIWESVHKGEAPMFYLRIAESAAASEGSRAETRLRATVRDAFAELWEKLGAGEIQASTVHKGSPYLIPAHEWPFLELIEHSGRDILRAGRDMFAPALTYDANEVLLRRDAVLKVWPPRPSTVAAEIRAEAELRDAASAARKGEAPWPKSGEWRGRAAVEFAIGQRGAGRAWRAVAKEFPELASPKGKSKAGRSISAKPKRDAD